LLDRTLAWFLKTVDFGLTLVVIFGFTQVNILLYLSFEHVKQTFLRHVFSLKQRLGRLASLTNISITIFNSGSLGLHFDEEHCYMCQFDVNRKICSSTTRTHKAITASVVDCA